MAGKKPFYMNPWLWILVILAVFALWIIGTYNSFISLSIGADRTWANLQADYQRRFDLIPRLINVTTAYAKFEKSTFVEVTQLRSQWESTTDLNKRVAIAQQSDEAFARLIAVFENYPNLQSIQAFTNLQFELAGTENRIKTSRMDYNNAVAAYNAAISYFPGNLIASQLGFTPKPYFQVGQGAENAPPVPNTLS